MPIFAYDGQNSYNDLIKKGLIKNGENILLHLGCGEQKLEGFINIDFPIEDRSLHKNQVADYFCDITKLSFPNKSVSKIENHHIFEHFTRATSIALLCAWQYWLQLDGYLVIETPDFEKALERFLREKSYQTKQIIIRHIFGSHEASWAIHYDGWYKEKFVNVLTQLGFEIESITPYSWSCLDNITVVAKKKKDLSIRELSKRAKEVLNFSRVNTTESEVEMGKVWFAEFENSLNQMYDNRNN